MLPQTVKVRVTGRKENKGGGRQCVVCVLSLQCSAAAVESERRARRGCNKVVRASV